MDENALRCLSPVQQIRIRHWSEIIHAHVVSGLTINQYCEQNGISVSSYYYYLAKIRKMAIDDLPGMQYVDKMHEHGSSTTFAEVHVMDVPSSSVVIRKGDVEIEISESISDDFLKRIMVALS